MNDVIDLDAYFARIGYGGAREPTLAALQALHAAHPHAIPFENLDVLLGRRIRLDLASLQAKLVEGRRGGYCFEHNLLFGEVLRALGFGVTDLAGRVQWMGRTGPRTHMLLRVETPDGPHLADVGFGGMVKTAALPLRPGMEQDTGHGLFRLVPRGDELQLQAMLPDGWEPMYQFGPAPQTLADYEMANWYVATHEASPFTSNLMVGWVTPERRYGLTNNLLSIHQRGGQTEKHRLSAPELDSLMHDTFGLARPGDAQALAALYGRLGGGA